MDEQLNRIEHRLVSIEQKVDDIMAGQASIDAAVTALNSFFADLSTQVAAIKAELANTGTVDTTKLDALVAQLPTVQAAVDALVTTPPPVSASASASAFRPNA